MAGNSLCVMCGQILTTDLFWCAAKYLDPPSDTIKYFNICADCTNAAAGCDFGEYLSSGGERDERHDLRPRPGCDFCLGDGWDIHVGVAHHCYSSKDYFMCEECFSKIIGSDFAKLWFGGVLKRKATAPRAGSGDAREK